MKDNCWYKTVCTQEDCSDPCIRYQEMMALFKASRIPKKRQFPNELVPEQCDYNAFCKLADIKDNVENFVENGENLYISSRHTGNGKTSWAIKIMLKYFDCIWAGNGFEPRGVFINVPTFFTQLKANISKRDAEFEKTLDNLKTVDLVIWDDIAAGNALTEYEHSQLLSYIDFRILSEKANIFTGNVVELARLHNVLGGRLASRVLSGQQIIFFGKDRRTNGTITNSK